MIAHSQLAPLPELPFDVISKTIGQGAYACIKKGRVRGNPLVFAVKFIHKEFALRHGNVTKKQLDMEITLHQYLGQHQNIVQFFQAGENQDWKWIAMELAEGGDLFDKIESDLGVGEDIAHVYFLQLISAVKYMHSKGVGHRDIKPENILLSSDGNLKIADFGLAALFNYQDKRKLCKSSCGSPPYTAPEVLLCTAATAKEGGGYYADQVDVWSCGVVLFVLLVGNTPWDEPKVGSYEFDEYCTTNGFPNDDLWHRLPKETLSLLRGMMSVDARKRLSLDSIKNHPWVSRTNHHITSDGRLIDPVNLATEMFSKIHIDFTSTPKASQQVSQDAMEIDTLDNSDLKTPTAEIAFDWETKPQLTSIRASQQSSLSSSLDDQLSEDPTMSQFAPSSIVPLSLTQAARKFGDILPSHSMTRFISLWSIITLLPALVQALQSAGVPVAHPRSQEGSAAAWIKIRTKDDRKCDLKGDVVVEKDTSFGGSEVVQVVFIKTVGDPVQWRRFFKRVVLLAGDAVWRPDGS